jgi:rsbT co-antagonist protein RsbR
MGGLAALSSVFRDAQHSIADQWQQDLRAAVARPGSPTLAAEDLSRQAREFLDALQAALGSGDDDPQSPAWRGVRDFLDELSRQRARAGFSSDATAAFIFSLKRPLFDALRTRTASGPERLAADVWTASELLDQLGLHTVRAFQKSREQLIERQQHELLELSTPVIKLWDGILALPMIGTLDSARTQVVMESLLQRIAETGAQVAIIDITGVPTVDTMVAQHLLKTVTALRLMGAECIISGIRPQIAQTIVHLGVDLHGVTTKANLADALALALKHAGISLAR